MADDRQNALDQNKNAGGQSGHKESGESGHQAPARNPNDGRAAGERGGKEDNESSDKGTEGKATGLNKGPVWADKQPNR